MAVLPVSDTIAAIATPPGTGGIGIIRISGPLAPVILQKLFRPARPRSTFESHKLYYGTITDPDGQILDEILAVHMRAPHTYTREEVVELHSHGSYLVLQSILAAVLKCGARPAEPGEFTKRAFLTGRIDLTRAEAVIDLLKAQTSDGVQLAVHQLQGELYARVERIRQGLVAILAVIEVAIDFPDEDVEILDLPQLRERLHREVEEPLARLLAEADRGRILRDGVKVVIAGRPNVGKSSLLNALLREDRALVTAVPGTTRDTIEEVVSIQGVPVFLVDTAGIREHADQVEELGIERARSKFQEADLILFLVDASRGMEAEDQTLYDSIAGKERIIVLNKIDVTARKDVELLEQRFAGEEIVCMSAREGRGLEILEERMARRFLGGDDRLQEQLACAPNLRHRLILEQTAQACTRLRQALDLTAPPDLLAVEVQAALDYLGDIVGITTPDDVLDTIFSSFCIGK
ncbi:tRNA uridine-5-carboxymethylaminomethyl(34) synthesis GTPase MnmE [Desulfolithobacter sp.]